jgi:hypothetical protein
MCVCNFPQKHRATSPCNCNIHYKLHRQCTIKENNICGLNVGTWTSNPWIGNGRLLQKLFPVATRRYDIEKTGRVRDTHSLSLALRTRAFTSRIRWPFFFLKLPNCDMLTVYCDIDCSERACACSSWASIRSQSVVSLGMLHVKQGFNHDFLKRKSGLFYPGHWMTSHSAMMQRHVVGLFSMYHKKRRISLSCSGHSPWKCAVAAVAMLCFNKEERACMNAPTAPSCIIRTCVKQNRFCTTQCMVGFVSLFLRCFVSWWVDGGRLRSYCRFSGIRNTWVCM